MIDQQLYSSSVVRMLAPGPPASSEWEEARAALESVKTDPRPGCECVWCRQVGRVCLWTLLLLYWWSLPVPSPLGRLHPCWREGGGLLMGPSCSLWPLLFPLWAECIYVWLPGFVSGICPLLAQYRMAVMSRSGSYWLHTHTYHRSGGCCIWPYAIC